MTFKITLLAAAGVAACLLASGTAIAQPGTDGPRGERAGMFERIDTNGDGVLTPAEQDAAKREAFARLDADANGFVTDEDLQAMRAERRAAMKERMAERRAQMAEDGAERPHRADGERPMRKWRKMRAERGERSERVSMVERLDTDGDGAVSQAEFLAHEPPHMAGIDTDGDGNITRAEADAAHEAMKEKMKERREKWREKAEEKKTATE